MMMQKVLVFNLNLQTPVLIVLMRRAARWAVRMSRTADGLRGSRNKYMREICDLLFFRII